MLSPIQCLWIFMGLVPGFVANTAVVTQTDFVHASFQQTFRFIFIKQEDGTCPDLSTYKDLLKPALDISKEHLPSLCTAESLEDRITGQLAISDISEETRIIAMNISLIYDVRQAAIYEQCKDVVASAFEKTDNNVTLPLRKKIYPLICPAIAYNRSGVLVHSGYFCRLPNQVRTQVQPEGFSHPIEVCVYCPLGEEVVAGSDECTPCRQGFYKHEKTATLCEPCPEHFVTRINGSITKDDCQLRACETGFYADVFNDGQCTACPYSMYQAEKWKEYCVACPAGFTTYQLAADTVDLCRPTCPAGQEYSSDTQSCQPCPIGYYNEGLDPSRFTCVLCDLDYITAHEGASAPRECNIRNCTKPGQYHDVTDNECRDCPRGQWQNRKWQTSCIPCDNGLTTRFTGTEHPAYCFILEDQGGFKLTKEEIILSMLSVLIALIIGNFIIVGYCLYNRSHRQKEHINSPDEPDRFKMTGLTTRRPSGTYEDINVYDIIRDIRCSPDTTNPSPSMSTFKVPDETDSSSHNYDYLRVYTQPGQAVFASEQRDNDYVHHVEPEMEPEMESDEPVYDDVMNTSPIYQNVGYQSSLPQSDDDHSDEVWSSRMDVLY